MVPQFVSQVYDGFEVGKEIGNYSLIAVELHLLTGMSNQVFKYVSNIIYICIYIYILYPPVISHIAMECMFDGHF